MKRYLVVMTILALVAMLAGGCSTTSTSSPGTQSPSPALSSVSTGTLEVRVHDAPAEVEAIWVTVDEVEIHKAVAGQEAEGENQGPDEQGVQPRENGGPQNQHGNNNPEGTATPDALFEEGTLDNSDATIDDDPEDISGWTSLSITGSNPFDLLQFQGGLENILATEELEEGKYTQIRMTVSKVEVVTLVDNTSFTHTAKLPSGKLKFVRPFDIVAGGTTILSFDFIAEEAIVFTGNDKVIFKPVIKLDVSCEPPPEPEPILEIITTSLPDGEMDVWYNASVEAINGIEPFSWTLSAGNLPVGLSLDSLIGNISGTPSTTGDYDFTVGVTDSSDPVQSDQQELSIDVVGSET